MRYLLLILAIAALAACNLTFQEPSITRISSFKADKMALDTVRLRVGLLINNPNSYDIKIKNHDLQFFLAGKLLGTSKAASPNILKANQESEVIIPIETDAGELKKGLIPFMLSFMNQGKKELRTTGSITVKVKGIRKKINVDEAEEVNLSDIIKKLTGIK